MSHVQSNRSRLLLLSGASALSLLAVHPAHAQVLTAIKGNAAGASSNGGNGAFGVAGPRLAPPGMTPQQAATKAQQSTADFNAAASAVINQLSIQAQARVAPPSASSGAPVPNGLGAGALAPAAAISSDPSLWQNANAPTQTTANGQTTVTIDQTAQKAILTWDSFNVGANTTVHFDQTGGTQSDGTNNWIVLNRIIDPSGVPSKIFGQIQAEGTVYLINRNGIMFGSGSQVDTHSLVASSLSFLGENINGLTPGTPAYDAAVANSNATFLNPGIALPESTGAGSSFPNLVLGLGEQENLAAGASYLAGGDITIAAGANIETHVNGAQGDGGYILIAAPNVSNAGQITADGGQAILAAGIGVSFQPNGGGSNVLLPRLTGKLQLANSQTDLTPISTLTNTGLVQAARGTIDLLGTDVNQAGVVEVTTGVSYPGSIVITAADEQVDTDLNHFTARAGLAYFAPGSVTANLPEEDGETATSSPSSAFTPGSVAVMGGSVTFANGSLVEAPGATVTVGAQTPGLGAPAAPAGSTAVQGRVYVDSGATIDVAGLTDVQLPANALLVTIPIITQNEIADDPDQAALLGLQNLVIDGSLAGTTAAGKAWAGTPILNTAGYVQLIPRKIDQLLVNAGSITLAGGQVLTAAGSSLNLDGGYIHNLGGDVTTTRLVDATGHMVAIGDANPNDVYVGVAGVTSIDHDRWGVTDTWASPLLSSATTYEPESITGGNAGTLTVYGKSVVVLDGEMSAQAFAGTHQTAAGQAPAGTAAGGGFLPTGGTFDLGGGGQFAFQNQPAVDVNETGGFVIQNQAPQLTSFDPNFNADTIFNTAALTALDANDPDNVLTWRTIPAAAINAGGFANVTISAGDGSSGLTVAAGTTLAVQPGGLITYKAPAGGPITVLGSLIAPSGVIDLETDGATSQSNASTSASAALSTGDITVGAGATISTAGLWVNDSGYLTAPGADAFVNGGSITLSAGLSASIVLEQGSVLDVASGGVLLADGLLTSGNVPVGKGGNLTLSTQNFYSTDGYPNVRTSTPITRGSIQMDGTIDSWGFSGGGKLTLQALGFQIGGDPSDAPAWDLALPADFFANQGFGSYQLNAVYDATVVAGAEVRLTQQSLIPNLPALAKAASGADITQGGLTTLGQVDPYDRQATNLILTAGGFSNWYLPTTSNQTIHPTFAGITGAVTLGEGAAIDADAGASVGLGSPYQVTVLGRISAPGGSITLSADSTGFYELPSWAPHNGAQLPLTTDDKSVWVGADAVLDVSGTTLLNPFAEPVNIDGVLQVPTIGKVLAGGSVILSDDTGMVVVQKGAVIDVSGASATLDQQQAAPGGTIRYAPQAVWSNAGSIVLGAGDGLMFDGTIQAEGGAPQAEGGTLTLLPEAQFANGFGGGVITSPFTAGNATTRGATALILQQSGDLVPTDLNPGDDFAPSTGVLQFAVDRLDGSGVSTLILGGGVAGPNAALNNVNPVPIAFAGDVSLSLGRALIMVTPQILALPEGATSLPTLAAGTTTVGGATVNLSAPYVEIAGPTYANGAPSFATVAALADGTFQVNASFIDVENEVAFANFGNVNLTSSGDLRLSGALSTNGLTPGVLYTPGDLTLTAADIYPASGETFIFDAVGPKPTTITFQANGAASTPLSAGGALLVDADNIVQGGTLQAPFGNLVLGVGDPTDAATVSQFVNLPLVATQSVTLTAGSLTSVSANGATLPYGTTTDGTSWTYQPVPDATSATDLTAPPAKIITINGTNVSLDKGATVDLSGGGTLQAIEWQPGTGGTRDLLSQYSISYANSTSGQIVPLYPDARNVYAVIPGYAAPVAAYDPVFAQSPSPTQSGQYNSLGVGQAGTGDLVGKAVYLSGVPGLPAGIYTLLPAKYATLPGAFRVVQDTSASNVAGGSSATLADGTNVVAGYFADAITGARSATPSLFDVQSAAVWGKYSQYALTDADTFFANQAAGAGTATPQLPRDAGQLVLSASKSLSLGATLDTAAGSGGAAAEVDIASQDIQIVGQGEAALTGYLQISASDLSALNAGSLLIGGTRTQTTTGVTLNVASDSIIVSNDAADPLTGPEILLAAKSLDIQSGSVITAAGSLPASADQPITIGSLPPASGGAGVSGDGALLRVSQGGQVDVTRVNVGPNPQGQLTVQAGAAINGGAALTLDSSGNLDFDPTATFTGTNIAVDAPLITFTNATGAGAPASGFVVGPTGLAQFASATQVDLRSFSNIVFDGDLNLTFGQSVELSAGGFVGAGDVSITAPQILLANDLGAAKGTLAGGQGAFTVNATEIDLGQGDKTLSGFGTVVLTATGGIVGQGNGSFNLGGANATLAAPVFLADTGSGTTLVTTGALAINPNSGTALSLSPVGGSLGFTAGSIAVNGASIQAPAGDVSLEATSGDLIIASGSLISSAGVAKTFYDTTQYAPGGTISLVADQGQVNVQTGSTLDFTGAQGGGAAGSLTLSAPIQTVQLNGTILGGAASGYTGGSLTLNTGGALDFTGFAAELASSGVDDAITVQTGAGNLVLAAGQTLKAQSVILTADGGAGGQDPTGGNIQILGTIDASGTQGGSIGLYGKSGVDIEGSLLATGSSATERGGAVEIGTVGVANVVGGQVQLDPTYGYELVSAANSGVITLGANSVIDVSGGSAGGLSNGTVNFRAPLLDSRDVNVFIAPTAQIRGSRATTLEAYGVWSTDDPLTYGAAKHFDGIVDPAGWYDATGTLLAGSFTNASGTAVASWNGSSLTNEDGTSNPLSYYLTNDYFAPTASNTDPTRTAHETFYGYANGDSTAAVPGTLMGFVENFPISSGAAARFAGIATITPGIELDNPDPNVNGGNITVLTNWNLGAGAQPTDLAFRFNGQAPVITFRAENDFKAEASLTDGFFQVENPTGSGLSLPVTTSNYTAADAAWNNAYPVPYAGWTYTLANYGPTSNYASFGFAAPHDWTSGDPTEIAQYYGFYKQYVSYIFSKNPITHTLNFSVLLNAYFGGPQTGQPVFSESAPTAADELANPTAYLHYLGDYELYVNAVETWATNNGVAAGPMAPLSPPPTVLAPAIQQSSVTITPAAVDNTPSPVAAAGNSLPLASSSLAGGTSSSFRIVAGANLASADPLAVQPAAASSGSVTLDDHIAYQDSNHQTIYQPTMIRTGAGSIEIAAADDVSLLDTTAPGVIYAAGVPVGGLAGNSLLLPGNMTFQAFDLLATDTVNPDAAGDVSIRAGGDIIGQENLTTTGATASQFWWQWMQTGNIVNSAGQVTQSSINFGAFDQGVMSVGGNVNLTAGGDIVNFSASLPTTWYLSGVTNQTVNVVGGGNLNVAAGGDILSGSYFVAKGVGTITAGGQIASSGITVTFGSTTAPVATVFAVQDGVINLTARQGVDIGAVIDPSYLQGSVLDIGYSQNALHVDWQSYSPDSALNAVSTTGDVVLNSIKNLTFLGASNINSSGPGGDEASVLPSSISLTAFSGGIDVDRGGLLYPSATGELSLIADQTIHLVAEPNSDESFYVGSTSYLGLIDADVSALPSPLNPLVTQSSSPLAGNYFNGNLTSASLIDHSASLLHAGDTQPVRIYSLNGSIIDGFTETNGLDDQIATVVADKPAQIYAGQDIVNLDFLGQNLRQDDITRIVAGRDIIDEDEVLPAVEPEHYSSLDIGGPGVFDVEAGRNITLPDPAALTGRNPFSGFNIELPATGIVAVGNTDNPYLAHQSADIDVLFGVGPGIANTAFIAAYVDPAVATPQVQSALVTFMEQWDEGQGVYTGLVKDTPDVTLTVDQAWSQFQTLPAAAQALFNQKALFAVLTQVGIDYNDPTSPFFHQYAHGYQAINTLFPASLGYTANSLDGGVQGAQTLVSTGNLDIRSDTIQTQQGGNISILGPGGEALVGAAAAPPAFFNIDGGPVISPADAGILTLEQGAINIFTDTSVLLAQSRIFTEQGGAITIWSSNGDINAGKGSKTVADVPPPIYVCDSDFYCTRDARGEVTGAGIATLPSIPGAPVANVELVAPRGTVDFGAAGVRVSGNLIVAAQFVANAANVQVQGLTIGVPNHAVDVSANLGASNSAAAATQEAVQAMQQSRRNDRPSIFIVTIDGFGPDEGGCAANTPGATCSAR